MTSPRFVERFLSNSKNNAAALELMRAVASDRNGRLLLCSTGESDPLSSLITEALKTPPSKGKVAAFLSDPNRRGFAKLFLLFLVSSFETSFQPNNAKGWKPFQEIVDELEAEGMILNLGIAAPVKGAVDEFLLQDRGAEYLFEVLASFEV